MAALLACFIEKPDKLLTAMDECKRMGIPVLPPDVNHSSADFAVEMREVDGKQVAYGIRYGMAAIKNVGRAAVEVILRARADGGEFDSLGEFVQRVMANETGVTRSTIENLIHAGAFSEMPGHGNRRALVQVLDEALQAAVRAQRDKKSGQVSLVDMFGDEDDLPGKAVAIPIPNVPDFPREQLLGYERDLLGLYISDHPLQAHTALFERRGAIRISELSEMPDRAEITLAGIVTSIKPFTSKKSGEPMAFFNLEDMSGTVACTMFPAVYAKQGQNLEKDKIVILRGKANHRERVREDDEGGHIVEVLADELTPVGGGSGNTGPSKIIIRLEPSHRSVLRFVRETVEHHRGNGNAQPVYLHVPESGKLNVIRTELVAEFSDPFRTALERMLGRQSVWQE